MPVLKHDIKSALPPRKVFGLAGDEVVVISRHGHVLIVEGIGGCRFPIIDDDLTERLPDAVDPPPHVNPTAPKRSGPTPAPIAEEPPEEMPDPASAEPINPAPRKQPKSAPKSLNNQGSLF